MTTSAAQETTAAIGRLRQLRNAHQKLVTARHALLSANLGWSVPEDFYELTEHLGAMTVDIPVPCVVCRQRAWVTAKVDDDGDPEPHAVLCRTCDERASADVQEA